MNDIVKNAFMFALQVHGGQVRKDNKPYIVHLFSVAISLSKNGADDNLICAGLLHDTIEDGGVTPEELKEKFGSEVLQLILFDTENKNLSWKERKSATLKALTSCSRQCAMLVCADKLSNIQDIAEGFLKEGEEIWKKFKYGKKEQEWLYRSYVDVLSPLSNLKMYVDFKQTVETVFHEGEKK